MAHYEPIQAMERHFDDEPAPARASGDWHVEPKKAQTGCIFFGIGINSDAGVTGSIVLNEHNFDVADPEMNPPDVRTEPDSGTQTPRGSISFPASNVEDKPVYFRVDIGYYRMR
jgi:hypothetical protein